MATSMLGDKAMFGVWRWAMLQLGIAGRIEDTEGHLHRCRAGPCRS